MLKRGQRVGVGHAQVGHVDARVAGRVRREPARAGRSAASRPTRTGQVRGGRRGGGERASRAGRDERAAAHEREREAEAREQRVRRVVVEVRVELGRGGGGGGELLELSASTVGDPLGVVGVELGERDAFEVRVVVPVEVGVEAGVIVDVVGAYLVELADDGRVREPLGELARLDRVVDCALFLLWLEKLGFQL